MTKRDSKLERENLIKSWKIQDQEGGPSKKIQ